MNVRVRFFGSFERTTGAGSILWKTSQATLGELWQELSTAFPGLKEHEHARLMSRNLAFAHAEELIAEDDELAFFPMVSGG